MKVAHLAVKDEADRYLEACLSWVTPMVDQVFVWDDRSTDRTVRTSLDYGACVGVRAEGDPSFLEAEGLFRQAGWEEMVDRFKLDDGDWVLTIDADEFPVGDLNAAVAEAERYRYSTIRVQIPEVFLLHPVSQRVDGYWGTIDGFRATQYKSGDQSFRWPGMGCGTVPAYADRAWATSKFRIFHYGYALGPDRQAKYDRYTAAGKNGHSNRHIESILATPSLVMLEGELPNVWRGRREETDSSVRR